MNTLSPGVIVGAVTAKWKSVIIGILSIALAASVSVIVSELEAARVKFNSIPDPSQLVTNTDVNQRLLMQQIRIETLDKDITVRLDRLEETSDQTNHKIDTLLLSMAMKKNIDAKLLERPYIPEYAYSDFPLLASH